MNLKNSLICIAVVLLSYYLWPRPENQLPDEEQTQEVLDPTVIKESQTPQKKKPRLALNNKKAAFNHILADSLSSSTPSAEGYRYTTPPKFLDFKVYKDIAVYQGDLLLGKVDPKLKIGRAEPAPIKLWESLEIPYSIHEDYPHKERVESALQILSQETNLSFVPFEGQTDSIVFTSGEEHCYSFLGRMGGHQPIMLSAQCRTQEILHEIMHALGFIHEQSRTDRNQYVDIQWNNIKPEFEMQFTMAPQQHMQLVGNSDFNFNSIMLYQPNAFAKSNNLVTIKSKTSEEISPERKGLSTGDINRINDIYY